MFRPTPTTPPLRLTPPAPVLGPAAVTGLGGVAATLALTWFVATHGLTTKVLALFALAAFLGLVAAFVRLPWVAVPLTVPVFAAVPTLKVFVADVLGGVKDAVSLAAICAAVITILIRRGRGRPTGVDGPIALAIGGLFLLYAVNAGGLLTGETGHGTAWLQGVRLFFEPLLLLVVGLVLPQPRRTFRAAMTSLVVTALAVALYGVVEQVLGVQRLLDLGYTYGVEVRQIGGKLRSFGTLGEPFTYASFELFAFGAVLLWRRRRAHHPGIVLGVLSVGLFFSYVRTAALIALALVALALAQRRRTQLAVGVLAVSVAAACIAFALSADRPSTRTVVLNSRTYVTLNGRTTLWREQLGPPRNWVLGRGVGAVGTAAQRARESLLGKQQANSRVGNTVVDSGYLGAIADVGVLGLALLLVLLGRVIALARRAIGAGRESAWIAAGFVCLMMIDALSQESFTAFPTAYLGMLLTGTALAATREGLSD